MARNWALVIDGEVFSVYRGIDDAIPPEEVSPVNAANLVQCPDEVQPQWRYSAGAFTPPPAAPARRVITPMAFMLRIPQAKRIAIRKYAAGEGAIAAAIPDYCDVVGDFLELLRTAQEIEIDGELVSQGLGLLTTLTLIDAADAAAITA